MAGKVASCHYSRLVEHSTNPDKIRRQKMMSKILSGISFSKAGLQQFLIFFFFLWHLLLLVHSPVETELD